MVDVCFVCSVCVGLEYGWARGARDGIENRTRVNDDLWGVEAGYVARKSFGFTNTNHAFVTPAPAACGARLAAGELDPLQARPRSTREALGTPAAGAARNLLR